MGAFQDQIRNTQANQANMPALAFAAGLLRPTHTGSFAESVGNAGEGALGALAQQRQIDFERQSKILELQAAKQQLLGNQLQTLLPYGQMQMGDQAFNQMYPGLGGSGSLLGGYGTTGSPAAAGGSGVIASSDGVAAGQIGGVPQVPDNVRRYLGLMRYGMVAHNAEALTAAKELMATDPSLQRDLAKATAGGKGAGELETAGARKRAEELNTLHPTYASGSTQPTFEFPKTSGGEKDAPGTGGNTGHDTDLMPVTTATPPAPALPAAATQSTLAPKIPQPQLDKSNGAITPVLPQASETGGYSPSQLPPGAVGAAVDPILAKEQDANVKKEGEWSGKSDDLDRQIQSERSLANLLKLTQSGQWGNARAEAGAQISEIRRQLGMDPHIDETKWGNPAAAQGIVKETIAAAMESMRSLTSRWTQQELAQKMKTITNPDSQPETNFGILSKSLGYQERERQMIQSWPSAQQAGWKNRVAYEQNWLAKNPADVWVDSAARRIGNLRGMAVPSVDHLMPGTTYVGKNGTLAQWAGDFNKDGTPHMIEAPKNYLDFGPQSPTSQ